MQNMQVTVKGNTLVIEIDGTKDLGPSSTGKTRMVASSQGNQKVTVGGRELYVGLNVYQKA